MANARLYMGGKNGSNEPVVAWLDPVTKARTDLPAIGGTGEIRSLEVIAEDDIWGGYYYQNSGSNYPKWAHWDGASWTIYESTIVTPFFQTYAVWDIYAVSSTEVYAIVTGPSPRYYVYKWDGAAWSIFASAGGIFSMGIGTTIMPGSTATDMWISNINMAGQQVAHWNGSSWDEFGTIGTLFVNVSGMRIYKGEIYCASYDSKAYTRTAPSTWTAKPGFDVPSAFDPRYGDCFFHDTAEDILWAGAWQTIGVNVPGVAKWDGTTMTFELHGISPAPNEWWDVAGFSTPGGGDAFLWFSILSSVGYRESNGTWGKVALTNFSCYTIQAFGVLSTAPELQNQDPAPSSTGNDHDTNVVLDIVDVNDDLDASSVVIRINGEIAWTGDAPAAGYSGNKSAITNGYTYTLDPFADFEEGTQTIRVVADDLASNTLDETYTFDTDAAPLPVVPSGNYDFTGIGVHPFVTEVQNPTAGVLEVTFSEVMLNDTSFGRPSSYIITPQGSAAAIFVTGVVVNPNDTTGVTLSFVGGGSTYILSTPGLMDPAGNYCNPPDFLFKITNPTFDELEPTQKLYLDTDMGTMALGVSELSQRRVEDLAILRAKNEGHLRQFSLIADELERSGIDRDDRKLKLFKG